MATYTIAVPVVVATSSVANPSVITTTTSHGFQTGDSVTIAGHAGSTPDINGTHTVTRINTLTFSIPVNVTVGGTGGTASSARTIQFESLTIEDPVNETGACRCAFYSQDASWRPAIGLDLIITEDATRIFGGKITKTREYSKRREVGLTQIVTEIEADSYFAILDRVTVTFTSPSQSLEDTIDDFMAALPSGTGITKSGSQPTGPTIEAVAFDKASGMDVVRRLVELAPDYTARVDYSKLFIMLDPASNAAPTAVTQANGKALGDVTVERTRRNYYNKVTVMGGHQVLGGRNVIGEVHTATAAQTKFLLAARMDYFGPVLLFVTRSAVTTQELVDGTVWSYDDTDYSINKGTASAMGAGDTISIGDGSSFGYWAKYPMAISATDASYTSDPHELIIERPDIFDRDTMQQLADEQLALYLTSETRVNYVTNELGLFAGQSQTLTFADRDVSGTFTITNVSTRNVKGNLVRRFVTAVSGSQAKKTRSREIYREWLGTGTDESDTAVIGGTGTLGGALAGGTQNSVQFNDYGRFGGADGSDAKALVRGYDGGDNYGPEVLPAILALLAKNDGIQQLAIGHTSSTAAKALTFWLTANGAAYIEHDDADGLLIKEWGGELQLAGVSMTAQPGVPTSTAFRLTGLNQLNGLAYGVQRVTSFPHTVDTSVTAANITVGYLLVPGSNSTVNLPALSAFNVSGNSKYRVLMLKNASAFYVTLDADSTDTINGALTYCMAPGESLTLIGWNGTGADWTVFQSTVPPYVVTLNNAAIKALPSGVVTVVPAPPTGFRIVLLESSIQLDNQAGAYTNVNADGYWVLRYGSGDYSDYVANDSGASHTYLTALLTGTDLNAVQLRPLMIRYDANWGVMPNVYGNVNAATALTLFADNNGAGDYTGGHANNDARISTSYRIEPAIS